MLFKYGNIYSDVSGNSLELSTIRKLLTFDQERPPLIYGTKVLTGLLDYLTSFLDAARIPYEVVGRPDFPELSTVMVSPDILDGITLRQHQQLLTRKILYHRRGVVDSPTGSGKTEIAAATSKILGERGLGTLMVVYGINSMNQAKRRYEVRGIEDVGRLGGGYKDVGHQHVVAVVNSLVNGIKKSQPEILALLKRTQVLLFMEVQHLPADSWTKVAEYCDAVYRIGLSATPFETSQQPKTLEDFRLVGYTGKVIGKMPDSILMNHGYMATPNIHSLKVTSPLTSGNDWNFLKKKCINNNTYRNQCIATIASGVVKAGNSCLTLIAEIAHGKKLCELISKMDDTVTVYFYRGQSKLVYFR